MPGVRSIVKLQNAVAVVADSWWRAKAALDLILFSGHKAHVTSAMHLASVRESVIDRGFARPHL